MINTAIRQKTAIMVGLVTQNQTEAMVQEYLDELKFLVHTWGAVTIRSFVQKVAKPDSKHFVGAGKLQEINSYIQEFGIDIAVFDDDLSPSQMRNIEKVLKVKVLDRSDLIIDIFAARAQTAHAKTQVELALYQHLLPRLTGMWTHLERQRGGTGTRGGAGEKEIETDRRIVRDKIALLKEKLQAIDKQMATQRKKRAEMIRVALVGYTNVGKSTIMNLLSKSDVLAENKLFATLDTTVRKVVIENQPFLLSDTVGFIRKLPTQLIESFKSTLDEVREADILVHIVDISHHNFEEHIHVVNQTLQEINAADKETIIVFNKIDAFTFTPKDEDDLTPVLRENLSLEDLKKTWMGKKNNPCIFISATQKDNMEALKTLLYQKVRNLHLKRYPYQ